MSIHMTGTAGSNLADDQYPYGKGYSYYVLGLLSFLYFFDFADRMVVAALFSDLNRDLGVTPAQFGLLTGIVNIAIACLAFPVSVLVDKWSRTKTVALMAITWGLACLLCAFTHQFWQLLVLRFLVGAGEAGYGPGASTIIQSVFPPNKQNSAIGFLQAWSSVGVVIGMVLGGIIAQNLGWRHAFGIVAIPGIIVSFLVFFLREPARVPVTKVNAAGQTEAVPFWEIMKKIVKTRTLVLIYLGMAVILIFSACVGVWVPSFFRYSEGLGQQAAGLKGAGIMLTGGMGVLFGGLIADRLGKIDASWPLMYASACMFLTCTFFLLAFLVVPQSMRYYFMLLGGFFLNGQLGITYTAVLHAAHRGIRAMALGCLIVVQNILGMAIGASLSGLVAQYFANIFKGTEAYTTLLATSAQAANAGMLAYGIQHAMVVMAFCPIIAGILFFVASRCYKADCDGAECFD